MPDALRVHGFLFCLELKALKAAGGTGVRQALHKGFGAKVMQIGNSVQKTDVDWVFTHSFDDPTIISALNTTAHPERPMLLMRVVRDPLANVEAYYRYLKRETEKRGGKQLLPFGTFAQQHIQNYRRFHAYWKSKCTPSVGKPGGAQACCVTATYEDLQDKDFLQIYFVESMKLWLGKVWAGPSMQPDGLIEKAVAKAISIKPPKHTPPMGDHRYTADHYLQLISD
jgi:hypothetical protein